MNDFDGLLTSDYGFKPHRKSPPISSSAATNRDPAFDDLFRSSASSMPRPSASSSSFDIDSIYEKPLPSSSSASAAYDNPPVYDRPPVYDEDIFEGIPGIKTASALGGGGGGGRVSYDDHVFAPDAAVKKGKDGDGDGFEELLDGFRGGRKEEGGNRSGRGGGGGAAFDDLLPGFGAGSGSGSGRISSAQKERFGLFDLLFGLLAW